MYQDEAGKLDFMVRTTGHGPVRQIEPIAATDESTPLPVSVVTSDSRLTASSSSDPFNTSCYVASRSMIDGSLNWRRNVCSITSQGEDREQQHAMAVMEHSLFTLDHIGMLKAWNAETGGLLWDIPVPSWSGSDPMVWTFVKDGAGYVATASTKNTNRVLSVHDASTGQAIQDGTLEREARSNQPNHNKQDDLKTSCEAAGLLSIALDAPSNRALLVRTKDGESQLDLVISERDQFTTMKLLACNVKGGVLLVASERGETKQLTLFTNDAGSVSMETNWQAEEGLGRLSSALLLDGATSKIASGLEENDPAKLLHFTARLESQWKSLSSMALFTGRFTAPDRSHTFGFVKVAVLLSSSRNGGTDRVYGMETSGESSRGKLRYRIDLPRNVNWHRLVHGGSTATHMVHGAQGGVVHYGRDVLAVSESTTQHGTKVHWTCFDAATALIYDQGSLLLSASITQIIPIHVPGLAVHRCRQSALLLLADGSMTAVPDNSEIHATIWREIQSAPNGFYAHTINKQDASVQSHLIASQTNQDDLAQLNLQSRLSGSLAFPGERIISVGYPTRDEVMESPCSVLGDDSLLLKYMNPHLAVILTMADNDFDRDERISSVLSKSSSKQEKPMQKRKPIGVTTDATTQETTEVSTSAAESNFFVNVVDTVAGRILYRIGHANAVTSPMPNVIVSENWVFYTYMNNKTRRAEIGVLSLYEGMIDSKGLTAFSSPERSDSFSSLDIRESPKPVVLAKTYSLAKPPTAIGMTTSRSGISTRRLVLAGIDGVVYAVDRRLLEPRRPLGQLKESEKKEGLLQYSELIPTIPFMSLSYHQEVEGVKGIVTAPTELESQTLVLAFGGPDIFFTRTSPSRGFDLLPDSFNRYLLSLIVAGMFIATVVLQKMVAKKVRSQGWG